ncbi:translation initiation factor eIF-2B subunit alpha [Diplogelasinospora grovesii]|uniref:Translation initiation factor eIF2B subunit alpha n=1 Tax=Diplogelasinospora grovesii TaxID=303347 RepID=A0AAN6NFH7_9PEZI|nr:translation initiation factor eIF-2B subunit alpha [Diplogelasinospora grovesii]
MATDELSSTAAAAAPAASASGASTHELPARSTSNNLNIQQQQSPSSQTPAEDGPFDIVQTYRTLLTSDPDITMPVAALESLIELLRATPSSTAMETVEVVKKEKARLLASAPNPLPLLAGADIFEQYLLRSLRGQTEGTSTAVLSFEDTRNHLLRNSQLFVDRAKAARDEIAVWGSKYVLDGKVVMTTGCSRAVLKILLRAAGDRGKHFAVIYVLDGSPGEKAAVQELREAGVDVETIRPYKIAYMLSQQHDINLILLGAEALTQNGGTISRMGAFQLAHLAKSIKAPPKRVYVAAETHKIVRKTPIWHPIVQSVGIRQKGVKLEDLGVDVAEEERLMQNLLAEEDEVDYTTPDLIDGIITEQGVKMTSQIWEMVEDYS